MIAKWKAINKKLPPMGEEVIVAIYDGGEHPTLRVGQFYMGFTTLNFQEFSTEDHQGITIFQNDWKAKGLRYWTKVPTLPKE